MKVLFRNNLQALSLRQGNLHLLLPAPRKTYNTQFCQMLLRNAARRTDEHYEIAKARQEVVEAAYPSQAKFDHRSGESGFEMTNATMADVEIDVLNAVVDQWSYSEIDGARIENALPSGIILKYGLSSLAEHQIPMSNEFDAQQYSSYVSVILLCSLQYQRDDTEYAGLCSDWCNRASGTPSNLDSGIKDHRRRKGEGSLESLLHN